MAYVVKVSVLAFAKRVMWRAEKVCVPWWKGFLTEGDLLVVVRECAVARAAVVIGFHAFFLAMTPFARKQGVLRVAQLERVSAMDRVCARYRHQFHASRIFAAIRTA
ncbi:MAG: hypothetical protein D6806_08710 [Deltaproteobacteria bacterium]|nr:MAG: hypothetical protein D6806_08710 [Deltaproteobacteria bacterium]